jgi:hypothetical protein
MYATGLDIFNVIFTPEGIGAIVGLVLTLTFAYFPVVRTWFAGLKSELKSYIMLGLLIVAEVVISLLAYYGVIVTEPPFTFNTALQVAFALLVANQPTYTLLPEANDVKALRLARDAKVALALVKKNKK